MSQTSFLSLLTFGAAQSLPWVLLYGAGTVLALRARRRHGAGWAVAGFGLLTVCAAARLGGAIWQTVLVTAGTPSALANSLTALNLWNGTFNLLALFGHAAVLAALVKAWRAADGEPTLSLD